MLFFAIAMVIVALVLYSVAVLSHVFIRRLEWWMVEVFTAGFVCDVAGTAVMWRFQSPGAPSLHVVIGRLAFVGMAATLVAFLVAFKKQGRIEVFVWVYARYSWALWVISFITALF